MPTIKINKEELSFNNIYYVHGSNGNDTTGNGSKLNPFKTFTKAYNSCSNDGDAIYLMGDENSNYLDYTGALNKNISIIGNGLDSKLHGNIVYSNYVWTSSTGNIKLYRLWLRAGQFFRESLDIKNEWYNCIITTGIGAPCYSTISAINRPKFYNCILDGREITYGYFRANCYMENCIIFGICDRWGDNGTKPNGKVLVTTLNNDTFYEYNNEGHDIPATTTFSYTVNNDFTLSNIQVENKGTGYNPNDSKAHIGVYGGPYAWGDWSTNKYFIFHNNFYKVYDENTTTRSTPIDNNIPTSTDYEEYGMEVLPVNNLHELEGSKKLITYFKDDDTAKSIELLSIPKSTIIKTNNIALSDVHEIKSITLTATNNNNSILKLSISPNDGNEWFVYRANAWNVCNNVAVDGNTVEEFNNISTSFNDILISNDKKLKLKFYFEITNLEDSLEIDKLSYKADLKGIYQSGKNVITKYDINFTTNNSCQISLIEAGNYKINY